MKYISFIIPCYNSSKYMSKCIKSILALGEDVEILIIDDGSKKDNTLEIAKSFERIYPTICRAIHKPNGGHGDALNVGIKLAKGLFVKVVDSDDWIDPKVGKRLLRVIKENEKKKNKVDLYVTDFVYDKANASHKKTMRYHFSLPEDKVIPWDKILIFAPGTYMLMHSLTYRTKVLKDCKLNLPKHTFYVDNIYAYKPLPYVKKLYYMDETLYHYFIGRDDQSVNEKVMISRLDQQYRVTRIMLYDVDLNKVKCQKLKNYMVNYMSIIMTVTSVFSILSKDPKWIKEKAKLWEELRKRDIDLYRDLMCTFLGFGVNLPGKAGMMLTEAGYKVSQLLYGFN